MRGPRSGRDVSTCSMSADGSTATNEAAARITIAARIFLYAFPPALVAVGLQAHGERAVVVRRLGAGPADGPDATVRLDLGAQDHLPAVEAWGKQERGRSQAAPERMASVEAAAHPDLAVARLHENAQYAGDARDTVVGHCHDQLGRALPLPLPDPRWPHTVADPPTERGEAARVGLDVPREVRGLGPERPVVAAEVQRVQDRLADHAHARRVLGERGTVGPVVPVIAVLHDHGQPRRTVREHLDLDRLVQDDAVG